MKKSKEFSPRLNSNKLPSKNQAGCDKHDSLWLYISDINQHGKTARGKKEILKYLGGGRLTPKQAILAHCYGCMAYFADGKIDCKMPKCPLHPFMAFNKNRQKRKTSEARR